MDEPGRHDEREVFDDSWESGDSSTCGARDELTRIAAGVRRARADERARLSRLLHDQLGQTLIGLKMDLHWVGKQLPAGRGRLPAGVAERLVSMQERLDEAVGSIRTISRELRAQTVMDAGLLAAIAEEAKTFERRAGIRCRVVAPAGRPDIDFVRSASIIRIVREALINVYRHARASRVTVSVGVAPRGSLTVSVEDDGAGIARAPRSSTDSLGLMGMREQASLLGGTFDIRRRRPIGTTVTLRVPLVEPRARSEQ
jgi:signal transduction histidine kinase